MFNDKTILITGGTGSFGKQAVRSVLERYQQVESGFEYNSGTNPRFLTVEEIGELTELAGV